MAVDFNGSIGALSHIISQSLLVPVMIILAIFFAYSLINLGILMAEYYKRRKNKFEYTAFIGQVLNPNSDELIIAIKQADIPQNHKEVLINIAKSSNVSPEFRESMALKMVEEETIKMAKKLEKTDIIAKIAPAVGLMGTLIPLGPGLTALGAGNIQELANHLTIAFDAAILGMAAAAVSFTVSKVRRRWYEEEISNLETMVDTIMESYNA